ncbi:MAG: AtpZ/AtpI family protein [Polyangia bacterium]
MWLQAASLSYLGIFFGISVVIGLSCGGYLDKRFHTTPAFRIVGVLFGLATGFNELYRIAKRYQRSQQQANREAAADPTLTPAPEPAAAQPPLPVNQTSPGAGPETGGSDDKKEKDGDEMAKEEDRERKDSWV